MNAQKMSDFLSGPERIPPCIWVLVGSLEPNPQGTQAHVHMVSDLTGIILILAITLASPRTTYIISGLALYS